MHDFIYVRNILPIVIGIVETWLYADIPDTCLNVPDYTVLRFDRPSKGGGVLLLINDKYKIINFKCLTFGSIQVLLCDVACIIHNFALTRFVCVYRPPNTDLVSSISFFSALETDLTPLKANFPIILMGDFNLTKIDWVNLRPTLNHTAADTRLLLTSQRTHLLQKVHFPSRHTNYTDLIFISHDNLITNVVVEPPFTTSDHNTISFDLLTSKLLPSNAVGLQTQVKLDFSRID